MAYIERITVKIKAKLKSERGDSLVEVLVSLLIGSLSLLMLGMSIAVASNLTADGKDRISEDYAMEDVLAMSSPNPDCQGSVSVTLSDGSEVQLVPEGTLDVSYCLPEDGQATRYPVVSYTAEIGD